MFFTRPLLLVPATRSAIVQDWRKHGIVLLRGLSVTGAQGFEVLLLALSFNLTSPYIPGDARRNAISRFIFISGDSQPQHLSAAHHEQTYNVRRAGRIAFYGEYAPMADPPNGKTAIARTADLLHQLAPIWLPSFTGPYFSAASMMMAMPPRARWRGSAGSATGSWPPQIPVPPISHSPCWQHSFQTDQPIKVAAICREPSISFRWLGHVLQVDTAIPSIRRHPQADNGERLSLPFCGAVGLRESYRLIDTLRTQATPLVTPARAWVAYSLYGYTPQLGRSGRRQHHLFRPDRAALRRQGTGDLVQAVWNDTILFSLAAE